MSAVRSLLLAAEAEGHPLRVTDGYRTREQQAAVQAKKPGLAVAPDRSRHVTGDAVDVEGVTDDAAAMVWVGRNAARFNLFQAALSKGEPYHLELRR